MIRTVSLSPLVLVSLSLTASATHADTIDTYVRDQMQRQHIPGLSLVVVRDGKVVKAKGYGFANLEWGTAATPDTVYQIGSITKQFTATLVMMQVEEGKVNLDEKILTYLPTLPQAWKEVTVRHLLTHTSGIPNYTEVPDLVKLTMLPASHDDVIKTVADRPLNFAPGEQWRYSNTNYFVLGMLLEKVTGKPYRKLLQERIFTPLGMTSTHLNDQTTLIKNRANGYDWDGRNWRNAAVISMDWPYAAGAMLSTVNDFVKWDAALREDRLLKRASLEQMWTPVMLKNGAPFNYGFGWGTEKEGTHRSVSHGGGIPGFVTHTIRYPEDHVMVTVFTNTGCDPGRIARAIARWQISDFAPPKAVSLDKTRLASLEGYYDDNGSLVETRASGSGVTVGMVGQDGSWYDWEPESDTRFFSRETGNRLTFRRERDGIAAGQTTLPADGSPTREHPRIGPLVRDIKPQTDPNPAQTAKWEAILKAIGAGGKAEQEVVGLTDGARRDFATPGLPDLAGARDLHYIASFDITGKNLVRHEGVVTRVVYTRVTTDTETKNLMIYLTADGLLTDFDPLPD